MLQEYLYLFDYARVFALDFLTRISMQEWLLDQWQRHKKTILFITHNVEEAIFLSSSVLVVEETPIHSLREIPVPLKYPRTRQDLTRPEIVELREQLVDMLRKQNPTLNFQSRFHRTSL